MLCVMQSDNGRALTYKYNDVGERVIKRGLQGEAVYVNPDSGNEQARQNCVQQPNAWAAAKTYAWHTKEVQMAAKASGVRKARTEAERLHTHEYSKPHHDCSAPADDAAYGTIQTIHRPYVCRQKIDRIDSQYPCYSTPEMPPL